MHTFISNSSIKRAFIGFFAYLGIALMVVVTSGNRDEHSMDAEFPFAPKGKSLWQQHNCSSCHSLFGVGGHIGPDLTNVHSRMGSSYIEYILERGKHKMPSYQLSLEERESLLQFFAYYDRLGKYPLNSVTREYLGSFTKEN
ncbi:MAG: cytochrome c [Opitutales bacterium]|nr:cytochrome c [Opitutales bacterium]